MGEWHDDLADVDVATERLLASLAKLTDSEISEPSLCSGWSRGHVLAHVAHNAQALGNLVRWARTGVETPAYRSREARDAAIERDASLPLADHRREIAETAEALADDLRALPSDRRHPTVATQPGRQFRAAEIPWRRLREIEFHHLDLDAGYGPGDWPPAFVERCLPELVAMFADRTDAPTVTVRSADTGREWRLGEDTAAGPTVSGPQAACLAWLSGRSLGKDLTVTPPDPLPDLPAWL